MNGGMIRFILGSVLKVESALLLFPCIVAVFYKESAGYWFLCEGRMCHDSHVLDCDQSCGMSAILFVW